MTTAGATPLQRVRRARRILAGTVALSAALWAGALAMSVVIVAAAINLVVPLPARLSAWIIPAAALAAVIAAGAVLWRGRVARSVTGVALWMEEHEPRLQFALVTAVDPHLASLPPNPGLNAAAGAYDMEGLVHRGWTRTLARAFAAAVICTVALAALRPQQLLRAASAEMSRRAAPGPAAPMANRLLSLEAKIRPPAYAQLPAETIRNPSAVTALVGSQVVFEGRGPADGITGEMSGDTLEAATAGRGWALSVTMSGEPRVLQLRDRQYHHLVVLEPRPDSAPVVELRAPASDTTYQQVPTGRLQIHATLADDVGLDSGYVEYLLSSGSGENFDVKRTVGSRTRFRNARQATLATAIRFDTLPLSPGSVLHIRVLAWDANDVAPQPGKGTSETRTLRIAEKLDSTSINPAPPLPIDSMWISQRLLNMRTDTLIRAKSRLEKKEFADRSSIAGNNQDDIRRRALAVIAILEEDGVGGSFETETSTKLREAAALMWTARMFLGVAEPETAMPVMVKILAILDEIRLALRYYLRGLLAPTAVNVERARLTGTDSADAASRLPRPDIPDARAKLAARVDRATALLHSHRQAAMDSLLYIRVSALSEAPAVAAALRETIEKLQRGEDAEPSLARVRRALEPPVKMSGGPVSWGGLVP